MSSPFPVRLDIKTAQHHTDYDSIRSYWRDAEAEQTFSGAWLFDHFLPIDDDPTGPCLEGWTLLAALAAQTERLRLGLMVTGNSYRYPAVLAKIASTVDIVSNGRLDFSIGAGWYDLEYNAYGIPFPSAADRIKSMGEACQVIKLLWTETVSNFEGQYYQLHDARCEPKPVQKPYPPIVIGGKGEKLTLREVARHADIYNLAGLDSAEARHKLAVLEGHCREQGRNSDEIRYSYQQYIKKPAEISGLADQLRSYIAIGIDHFVIGVPGQYYDGLVEELAQELAPLLEEKPQRGHAS